MRKHLSKNIKGLTSAEVEKKIKCDGFNEIQSQKPVSVLVMLFKVLCEPMILLLLASGTIYFILGEPQDAAMLMFFVFVVVGITLYQERKTERALEALKNLASPRALVIRNGKQIRIAGREVVCDDIIVLHEGDRVPADAVVLNSSNLLIDESLLTGESLAVRKSAWNQKDQQTSPGGEDLSFVFSGTLIVGGSGIAKVTSIGISTEMGKIGKSLQAIRDEETLLKKEMRKIVKTFTIWGFALCSIIVAIYGLMRGDWLKGVLSGLTLAMAILPEEFPLVMLIFLTLGAWRMSKKKVLTRKTTAIETLGAATVLCTDKTGTLTFNRMQLEHFSVQDEFLDIASIKNKKMPESFHDLMEYANLASQWDPFDPIEKEIKAKSEVYLSGLKHIHTNWKLVKEYALSKDLLALSHVWSSSDKSHFVIAAKGAPEAIADLCHLSKEEQKKFQEKIEIMSKKGLRLIGVAKAIFSADNLPSIQHDFNFEFVGILGFSDPIRPNVLKSIQECYSAGVRVIMITGDYPGTAQAIAQKIGLKNPLLCITGPELKEMEIGVLREKIREVNVFARMVPEQKLAIMDALKANGEIVAMTGDGVNDAPALKSAHIGIAMGKRGTDVARETSDLVLLNDDFNSIVQSISLGRRIFDNIQKAMAFIVAVHIPIAGMSLFPVLFNLPIIFLPAHIAFLELIIDPACSVVFESEKEEKDIMLRPPRNLQKSLLNKDVIVNSLLQGLGILAVVMTLFLISKGSGFSEDDIRTLVFFATVIGSLALITANLSKTKNFIKVLQSHNQMLYWTIAGTLSALGIVLYIPFFQNLFHFSYLHPTDLLIGTFLSLIIIFWFEGIKYFKNRRVKAA
ncbi:cation-translocating P-type ATPase [Patescibacteria group bacterium]|nr:cation-translocating P-type ATPase [Patescibacteria group bacterium]